jgi:DNA-binding winged helix-turn-helix (wHTH) protein
MMFRCGALTLDTDRRQLLRDGTDVHVTRKAFDLLAVLIQQAPRVVPKAELHTRLWPDTFVSDATLVGLIKELRGALRDDGPGEPLLRTVHGVGYAFGGHLEDATTRADPLSTCWIVLGKERITLPDGEHIVGRDPGARVRIDAANVSRQHARIRVAHGAASIEDLGSKNGTTVGERRVGVVTALGDGDRIRIGTVLLTFRSSSAGVPTETLESSDAH